jgi:TetR/AcrR family transcriptional repressor of nem operon
MARPKEFDQEKALRKAVRIFSQQGFASTSTDELMRVMDVGRQSMYDTFGDKRKLFLKALEMYVTESVHSINVALERPGLALSAVQNALVTFAERKDLSSAEGCMGLNAISEFGQRDADVTRITRNAAQAQRQKLMGVFARAKMQGELGSDADLDSMADFFESTLAGIRMAAKAGKSRRALRNIAAFAGRAYMGSNRSSLTDMLLAQGHAGEALTQYKAALRMSPNRFDGLAGAALRIYCHLLRVANGGRASQRPEIAQARAFLHQGER